jgi:hypothetical protein
MSSSLSMRVRVLFLTEVKIRIDAMPRSDVDVHATRNRHLRVCALRELDAEEVVPQVEVGVNPMKVYSVTKIAICKIPEGVRLCSSRP